MASSKMIRRVVTQSVTVVREGARVTPTLGKAFAFTADEIEYLDRVSPGASRKAVNEDVNEAAIAQKQVKPTSNDDADEDDLEDDADADDAEEEEAPAKPAKAKAAVKKTAAKPAASVDDDI